MCMSSVQMQENLTGKVLIDQVTIFQANRVLMGQVTEHQAVQVLASQIIIYQIGKVLVGQVTRH